MIRARGLLVFLAAAACLSACDDRLNPTAGGIRRPPATAPTGDYVAVAVNDTLLPHPTTNGGVIYSLLSGTFSLNTDSTWQAHTVESLTGTNGVFVGTSPANYVGTWRVTDSTVNVLPTYGSITVKGDTLFWRGGPKHTWEDSIKVTLVRK